MTRAAHDLVKLSQSEWPPSGAVDERPRPLAGFIVSSFSPLVVEVAERCLRQYQAEPPAAPSWASRTGVLLMSARGDVATNSAVGERLEAGRPVQPLLFYQSVPNSAVGYLARIWGLGGPVICASPVAEPVSEALELAALVIEDGDADRMLVVSVEQACLDGERDTATALLVAASANQEEKR